MEEPRMTVRSPSRASQQPIRAVSPRVRRAMENDDLVVLLLLINIINIILILVSYIDVTIIKWHLNAVEFVFSFLLKTLARFSLFLVLCYFLFVALLFLCIL